MRPVQNLSLDHEQLVEAATTSGPTFPGGRRLGPRPVGTVVLSWLAMIGVDFFLHAGLLARDGALIAAALGAVLWGALIIGLWSISTADAALLGGWWVGQTIELALGGAVVGAAHGGVRRRTVAWRVGVALAVGAISAVALQAIGYATAPVISR